MIGNKLNVHPHINVICKNTSKTFLHYPEYLLSWSCERGGSKEMYFLWSLNLAIALQFGCATEESRIIWVIIDISDV